MKVIQLLPSLCPGDAIGNDALAKDALIGSMGYSGGIYAQDIAKVYRDKPGIAHLSRLPALEREDVVIYHHGTGSEICNQLSGMPCRKLMVYHNVTPHRFFTEQDPELWYGCAWGERCTQTLRQRVDACIADSAYNAQMLREAGYSCPVEVCPVLIPFADYEREANPALMEQYDDGRTNILFVGRVVANKCQHDILRAFALYKKYYDEKARLFIVGGFSSPAYAQAVQAYAGELGTEDVHITGSVPFADILAYYRMADLFLCMSEHEGFCVPLIESMYFDVPVLAYASSAIPDTLSGSGVMLEEKDFPLIAGLMARMAHDEALRGEVLAGQRERLKFFSYESVSGRFKALLEKFIKEGL